MILKGFEVDLHYNDTTDNWSIVDYGNGKVFLEVYFKTVDGVDIRKQISSIDTEETLLKEYPWLLPRR